MEECTFNWIYRNFILIICLGLAVFTKEESQQYSYECNENGDITLLGLLQNSQVTIKEVAYKNGSSVFPNCTFTADQYGHVIINRSCTNDFPEMRHKVIVFGILDALTVSSTTVSSSQTSIATTFPAQITFSSSVMSVIDVSTLPSTHDTSSLSSTLNMPTSLSTKPTQNLPTLSTTSPTAILYTSSSAILPSSSSTLSTTNVSTSSATILTSSSSTLSTTNSSTSSSTLNQTSFDSPLMMNESIISPEIGLKSSMKSSLTSPKTKSSTTKTNHSVVQSISSQPFTITSSNTEMKQYPKTTLKNRRVSREKRAADKKEQTFMLTCQQYENGVIHHILGQLIDRDTISLIPVFNSVGRVEMQFKSYRAETEDALKYLPDVSTVYLGDKFFMFLKYMGQQDYKIVPQNCSAYDGGVAVTNSAQPNVPLWSYDRCVSEIARKYHLMHNFEKMNDKILFAELFGFHFVDDADITVECDVMICNKADNSSMCTLKQNDCGKTTSNLRAKRTTKKYVKVVRKLKVMNRRQQNTENTAMKHRHNSLMLLIGAVIYGVEYLMLA